MEEKLLSKVVRKTNERLKDINFLIKNRKSKKDFTRTRKMGFVSIVLFLLNFVKKTLQLELDNFDELIEKNELPMSKAAFSKARRKISEEAFKELYEISSETAMEEDIFKRYNGYRIFAIDGTQIQLENTKELVKEFSVKVKNKDLCRARASILCEVFDGVVIDAKLDTIHSNERSLAMKHIDKELSNNNILYYLSNGEME